MTAPYSAERPTSELRDLHKRFAGRCYHCRRVTLLTLVRCPMQATRDHLIPRSKGGGEGENVVLSCYKCNQDKGDTMPNDFVRNNTL